MNFLKTTLRRLLLCMAIPLMTTSIFYVSQTQRAKAEFWYKIQAFFPNGTEEAHWCIDRALKADPTFAKGWMEKSKSLNKSGLYAEGFHYLNKAVALEPTTYLGHRGYLKLYMLRDYEGAIEDLERLEELNPEASIGPWRDDLFFTLGVAYQQLGEYRGAIYYFNTSVKNTIANKGTEAINKKVFLYRGISLFEMGRVRTAIKDFNRAINHADNYSEAYYYRGLALIKLHRRGSACRSFRKSLELFDENNSHNAHFEMPNQIYLSDIEEAMSRYCKAL